MKSIYIKPNKIKHFDIFDENKRKIGIVKGIHIQPFECFNINLEIVDDMIHIRSDYEFEIEPIKNTLIIRF